LILPTHDDGSEARIGGNVVIGVLGDVGLVVHDEAAPAEAEILDHDRVARQLGLAAVGELEMPQPQIAVGMQPKRHAVLQAEALALPDEAVAGGADTACGAGSDAQDAWLAAADAQIEAPDPTGKRRAQHLIEHDAAALMLMLDREQAAVRQRADRQAGGVGDLTEAEIAVAGGGAGAGAVSG